ncbi:MAG TPA: uroporphyrinogen-III synthase [Dehalococcoidia bacterium]|nr:uroporphyrinogen-III synthase [Chloroflexota bacterium]HAA95616.1 uroporphyrinogen-III synthase [Dehalococcoidia bacterium]HCL24837.1 uroporphyrinogen-III synthase [Dehalococcoidia bacterium]|tara:strand:- start:15965 stop:16738 length:774 start_codon:yes stop_codon:yes gene_type:complete
MLSEMGALIERHGGTPYAAPVLQEVHLGDTPEVISLVDDVCSRVVQVMVFQTGVGTKALFDSAESLGKESQVLDALANLTVISRSPKPSAVLRRKNVHIDHMPPEPFTSNDLIETIGGLELSGKSVAIQAYGGPNGLLTRTLRERGATVREVSTYTWGMPEDTAPVLAMIEDLDQGSIDALAFTSQPQIGNLIAIAAQTGKEESLRNSLARESLVVASVGPVTTKRMLDAGIKVDVEPDHPHMGNLVLALADRLNPD